MVWIYGGGYTIGDNYEFGLYDATNLVQAHGYVHVAMNYRLSALGFLALQGLQQEDPYKSTGNYALQDQQAALMFVQKNIAAFGGDPTKVTIFGESAGAFSVCWHLVSPRSKGLFRAAIMESGNCENPGFFYPEDYAISWGNAYATTVGCNASTHSPQDLVTCLRGLTTAQVLNGGVGLIEAMKQEGAAPSGWHPLLYPFMPWGPCIDKSPAGLADVPYHLLIAGKWNKVPVVLGTNANEGVIFVPALPFMIPAAYFPLDEARFKLALAHFFNSTTVDQVTQMYYYSADTWESVAAVLLRDFFFACPARRVARTMTAQGIATYLYHFTFVAPNWIDSWILGDYHSAELEYVFDNPWPPVVHVFDEKDDEMAATLGSFWTNLAYSGTSPNEGPAKNLQHWPRFAASTGVLMNMRIPTQVDEHYLESQCNFWDTVVPVL